MRGAADRSSLCHPGFHRQDVVSAIPAVRPSCRATPEASSMRSLPAMSEVALEFGDQNPFIPPSSALQSGFEAQLIFAAISVALSLGTIDLLFVELRG